jgi:2-iminobutanoate/2-iminopropanoate deaminase
MEKAMAKKEIIHTPEFLDLGKFMKAPVSPAVRANGFIFTGGYVPMDPKTGKAVLGPIEDQARRTLDNLRQVLELAGSSLDKVVRVNIFLSDEKDFEGLNKVYREFFPDNFPARRTILSPLVGGFRCEIDCTALE